MTVLKRYFTFDLGHAIIAELLGSNNNSNERGSYLGYIEQWIEECGIVQVLFVMTFYSTYTSICPYRSYAFFHAHFILFPRIEVPQSHFPFSNLIFTHEYGKRSVDGVGIR